MLVFTDGFQKYTNDFLGQKYDDVSPDVSPGSIVQSQTSGRDGRGGLTFTAGDDSDTFEYPLYVQQSYEATDTIIVGVHVEQTAAQVALGGRLLTIVDGGEDIFGLTTQVGINIMSDGTLQVVRANDPGTGIVLRGLDQGGDSQTTLLGTSPAVDADDYLEIKVFHHPTAGSVEVQKNNVAFWTLANVNTAISGREQSTGFCLGGFASVGVSDTTRHHEDLKAVLSDLHVINNIVNPSDSRDPVSFIGDQFVLPYLPIEDETYTEFTPSPVQDHFLNVNEVPPDEGDSTNSTLTLDDKDDFTMQPATGSTEECFLAYSAFLKSDSAPECVSGNPALFESPTFMAQTTPGEVHVISPSSPCNLSQDFTSHRAQSVCTISQDGDQVEFKARDVDVNEFFIGLSPLNTPPMRLYVGNPGGQFQTRFTKTSGILLNMISAAGVVAYTAPFYVPWAASALSTEVAADANGDYFEFAVPEEGAGMDIGFLGATTDVNRSNFYNDTEGAFHFREDIAGAPYFYIGKNFSYTGETVYSYAAGDRFKIVRTATARDFYKNDIFLETVAGALPTHLYPYALMGRWGYRGGSYSVQPRIINASMVVTYQNCISGDYFYRAVVPGAFTLGGFSACEPGQWGIILSGTDVDPAPFGGIFDPSIDQASLSQPTFGWDENTRFVFKIDGTDVVLEIHDWVGFLDNITNVAGVGVWTFSRAITETQNFQFLDAYPLGVPVFPQVTFQYQYVNAVANMPVWLVIISGGTALDSGTVGINDVEFTFADNTNGAMSFAGLMRQSGNNKTGSEAEAPTSEFRYKQSFLATAPDLDEITVDKFNESEHGYQRK